MPRLAASSASSAPSALFCAPLRAQTVDSSFTLSATDPGRSPSPFIGNGRLGGRDPAARHRSDPDVSGRALRERAGRRPAHRRPADLERHRYLRRQRAGSTPTLGQVGAVEKYRQTVDMRTGTARTSYDWVDGALRISVRVETFVSRAEPRLAALRLRAHSALPRAASGSDSRSQDAASTQRLAAGNARAGASRTGSRPTSGIPDT